MSYIFKQKFTIGELVESAFLPRTVLVREMESYLLGLYTRHLSRNAFAVRHAPEGSDVVFAIADAAPDVFLFSFHHHEPAEEKVAVLQEVRNLYPTLPIVTVGRSLNGDVVKRLMALGVQSHVDRHTSRPEDIALIIKTLFYVN